VMLLACLVRLESYLFARCSPAARCTSSVPSVAGWEEDEHLKHIDVGLLATWEGC
jgi:hypothetical protein